jgi:hypothetical protein
MTSIAALELEREALTASPAELAAWLQDHLGQKIAAFALGLADAKMVGRYAAGRTRPRDTVLWRMQHAYQAARLVVEAYGDVTAKSWFFGTNSILDDRAPALVLREAVGPADLAGVIPAARSFAGGGFS